MERATPENKDFLTLAESVDYFRLSRRKFSAWIKNTQADILAIHRVVLTHVLAKLLIAHGLGADHATVPLAEGCGLVVLVLRYFYDYRHDSKLRIEN